MDIERLEKLLSHFYIELRYDCSYDVQYLSFCGRHNPYSVRIVLLPKTIEIFYRGERNKQINVAIAEEFQKNEDIIRLLSKYYIDGYNKGYKAGWRSYNYV